VHPSVCLSSRMYQLNPHWKNFGGIWCWGHFLMKICRETPYLDNMWQTYQDLKVLLLPATHFRLKAALRNTTCFCCWRRQVPRQYTQDALLRFNCNNVFSKPRQCYVICTLPFLLSITLQQCLKHNHEQSAIVCNIFLISLPGNSSHFFISTYHLIILLPLC